jgi:hypothetical protein
VRDRVVCFREINVDGECWLAFSCLFVNVVEYGLECE